MYLKDERRFCRAGFTQLVFAAASGWAALAFGSGCGGTNPTTDVPGVEFVTSDRSVTGEFRAGNLTIAEGATLSSAGDLVVRCTGKLTLNGRIKSGGRLTLVIENGLDSGPKSGLEAGDGNLTLVSSSDLIPTQQQIDDTLALGSGFGTPASRAPKRAVVSRAGGAGATLPPINFPPGAMGGVLWINYINQLNVGSGGPGGAPYVLNLPAGRPGLPDIACDAHGKPGRQGGSVVIHADRLVFAGPVTINLGAGGRGGNGTANNCCPAVATGGKGGSTGAFRFSAEVIGIPTGMSIRAPLTLNYGIGGRGGDATAIGLPGANGCPAQPGCEATAVGGQGGEGALDVKYTQDLATIDGLANVTVNANTGGRGGDAVSTAGRGGDDTCCPGQVGGRGGHAVSMGGAGGKSKINVPGVIAIGLSTGGNGGDSAATGGNGGDGNSCCGPPPLKGGDGGAGGNASAFGGAGGDGDGANGAPGNVLGNKAGDGGNGGDGIPPGAGGAKGIGTNVPDGNPGAPGKHCQMPR